MKKFFGFGSSPPPPPAPPNSPGTAAKDSGVATIVGSWKEPDGSDTTEFRADGTVVEKPASGETIRGRYSLEGAKLKIRLEGLSEELSFSASIEDDALELKDPDGQITHYRRA